MAHQVQVASPLPTGVPYVFLPNKINAVAGQVVNLTDDQFAQLAPDIFSQGYLIDNGEIGVAGGTAGLLQGTTLALAAPAASTLASGSLTAGTASYRMGLTGAGLKMFVLNLAAATSSGAATITFPTAFTVAPAIIGVAGGAETAITTGFTASTTTLTIPTLGSAQTGWIIVVGW